MSQRKPLQILVVGTAGEKKHNDLIDSIKRSDSTAVIKVINSSEAAFATLKDNNLDFDATYITFNPTNIDSFKEVEPFVNTANESAKNKNGLLVLSALSEARLDQQLVDNFKKKKKEIGLRYFCYNNPTNWPNEYHNDVLNPCREQQALKEQTQREEQAQRKVKAQAELAALKEQVLREQARAEQAQREEQALKEEALKIKEQNQVREELASLDLKKSLQLVAEELQTEIEKMRKSPLVRWAPNEANTIDKLYIALKTAADTFSFKMSPEQAAEFDESCEKFLNYAAEVQFLNVAKSTEALFCVKTAGILLAATALIGGAMLAGVLIGFVASPVGLIVVGVVGLAALGWLIAEAVSATACLTETAVIGKAIAVSEIIKENNVVNFEKDPTGALFFKPKKKEEAQEAAIDSAPAPSLQQSGGL